MKRWLILFSVFLLLPIPKFGELGAYNTISRLAYCTDYSTCLHEIGHALDRDADWISQSSKFSEALQMYILTNARNDDLVIYILAYTLSPNDYEEPTKREIYAYLFQYSNGSQENLPETFRKFYDWQAANGYIKQLDDGKLYLFNRSDNAK